FCTLIARQVAQAAVAVDNLRREYLTHRPYVRAWIYPPVEYHLNIARNLLGAVAEYAAQIGLNEQRSQELAILSGGIRLFKKSGHQDAHVFCGNTDATTGWDVERHRVSLGEYYKNLTAVERSKTHSMQRWRLTRQAVVKIVISIYVSFEFEHFLSAASRCRSKHVCGLRSAKKKQNGLGNSSDRILLY